MKIFFLIIVSFIYAITVYAQQSVSTSDTVNTKAIFGIKGGVNISSFSASVNSETKPLVGLNLGIYIKKKISDKFFFRPEIYYSKQGQKDNFIVPPSGPSIGSTTTTLNYLNVPILFELGKKISFQFGPQISLLMNGTEKGYVASVEVDDNLKDVMTKVDLGMVLGLGISPIKRLNCGIRYNIGITDIYIGDDDSGIDYPNISNRVFHFYIATSF